MHIKSIKIVVRFCVLVVALFVNVSIFSQRIERPSLSGATRCIDFNEPNDLSFAVEAQITGGTFPEGTTFTLQLSNKEGNFGANVLDLVTGTASSGSSISFENVLLPEFDGSGEVLGSDEYVVRVVANVTPIVRGRSSSNLVAYSFRLPEGENRLKILPSADICGLDSDPNSAKNILRVKDDIYGNYQWFRRDFGSATVTMVGEGAEFRLTQTGIYYYQVALGGCDGFVESARSVNINVFDGEAIDITISSNGTPTSICDQDSVTLTSSITDPTLTYSWVKNGETISGENSTSLTVTGIDAKGSYQIQVVDTKLGLSERCVSQSNAIDIDLLNPSIKITSPLMQVDIPGQDEILTVEVSDGSPVITWFKDGVEIENSNTTSLVSIGLGTYNAKVVDATSPCDIKEVFTENEIQVLPISNLTFSIEASDDQVNDCALASVDLSIANIRVFGATDAIPLESISGLDFTWFRDNEAIDGETNEVIRLSELAANGNYRAEIDVNGTVFASENNIDVKLNLDSLRITQDPDELVIGESVELSLELPLGIPVSDFAIQWIRGVNFEIPGETGQTLTVVNPGTYTARVSLSGCGSSTITPISIQSGSAVIPNVLSRDIDALNNDWIIPTTLSLDPEIKVEIYTNSGQLDYTSEGDTEGYSDQWPSESKSQLKESIYYYVISKNNNPVEKGSITIIR
ncbi:T9SS type B sorting domain-containing protein [Aquimarina agarilytica]|uniref:T9SS type B sorting domain-containing protein n=1 Tax=Aquimarina agarilytica TaxID=1087449 RepID=UPI00028899EF|nr:gliding motility-associated C-terminal domain-containing protein [Aquimarina agarilytica]